MTSTEFDTLLEARLQKTKQVLASKAVEYATNDDRLHNFKRAAAILGCRPAQALNGMWVKHLVSIQDLIRAEANYQLNQQSLKLINEKIGDAINYLILLEALFIESIQSPVAQRFEERSTKHKTTLVMPGRPNLIYTPSE